MITSISTTKSPKTPPSEAHHHNPSRSRPPLLPSDNAISPPPPTKPKPYQTPSRYMSTSPSSPSLPKRPLSAQSLRPATPLLGSKQSNVAGILPPAAKVHRTSSRSLSVSFQGEAFSLPISKIKAAPSPPPPNSGNVRRRGTPERRGKVDGGGGDQLGNLKVIDRQCWPSARIRQLNPLTRSLDCTSENLKVGGTPGSAIRALEQSMLGDGRWVSMEGRIRRDLGNVGVKALSSKKTTTAQMGLDADSENGSDVACDVSASDRESVSTGSNSGVQEEFTAIARGRGIGVPARFWQETNSRLRRLQEPCSPLPRTTSSPKVIPSKKATLLDSPSLSPHTVYMNWALSSPNRGRVQHPSPSKLPGTSAFVLPSPSRGMQSPTRMRNSLASSVGNLSSNMPSIISFAADVRRGKMGENRIEDAHLLRMLYNRYFQWRFLNGSAEAAISVQRPTAEKNMYIAWKGASELRDSVTVKKIQLQLLRQNRKLTTILEGQLFYLEEWALLDRDHSNSFSGAFEALKASTLILPVIDGARADIQKVKDAVCSAVDVMQALGSSICSLLSKVQGMNSLVAGLANVATQQQELLSQCKDLLSIIAALRVEERSLRTHLLQQKWVP